MKFIGFDPSTNLNRRTLLSVTFPSHLLPNIEMLRPGTSFMKTFVWPLIRKHHRFSPKLEAVSETLYITIPNFNQPSIPITNFNQPTLSAPLRCSAAPAKHFITRKQKLHSSWETKFTTASCFQGRWMKLYGR